MCVCACMRACVRVCMRVVCVLCDVLAKPCMCIVCVNKYFKDDDINNSLQDIAEYKMDKMTYHGMFILHIDSNGTS